MILVFVSLWVFFLVVWFFIVLGIGFYIIVGLELSLGVIIVWYSLYIFRLVLVSWCFVVLVFFRIWVLMRVVGEVEGSFEDCLVLVCRCFLVLIVRGLGIVEGR